MVTVDLDAAGERVADILDQVLAEHPTIPGAAVALRGADGSTASVVRGVAVPATGEPLTIDHAFRIASCTKSFVAATVVSLIVEGRVALDDPLIDLLDPATADLLAHFEHGRVVTVRQILQHRSGLVDHSVFPEFSDVFASEWTALRQVAIAVGKPALFPPDTAFSYSDSGYVLLGQMIEHLTGLPLATAVRNRARVDATEMPSLHWELVEPTPPGLVRAHQLYEGDDTHDWSPTFDLFGGGGLVSTLPDLCTWWTNWFTGVHGTIGFHLADPASTLAVDGAPFSAGPRVGLGVFGREVSGRAVWLHSGFWGLETGYVPELDVAYALSLTHRAQGNPSPHDLGRATVAALAEVARSGA